MINMMNNKRVNVLVLLIIFTSLLGVIGFTYSYFSLEVDGSSKDIIMNTGDLRLKYEDNNILSLENALPGDYITKTMVITNIGNKKTSYNLVWKDLINEINYFDLHLDVKCKSYKNYGESNQEEYGECKSFYKAVPYSEIKIDKVIKRDIEIEVGITDVFEITISFLNRTYPQDDNINKSFNGRIEIEEYIDNSYYCYSTDDSNYVNGQYTYTSNNKLSWSVQLTDKTSTEPVNTKVCTYINDKPVTSYSGMFRNSNAVSIDLSGINTKNVTNMYGMFWGTKATEVIGLDLFDTSNVLDIQQMFRESNVLNLDLSSFDTSKINSFLNVFSSSKATYIDVSSFDTKNASSMASIFNGTYTIDYIDLSSFNTSKVTNMNGMFWGSSLKNIDVSSFDTSNVTSMKWMFMSVKTSMIDISNFNTSNVTDMTSMFQSSRIENIIGIDNFDTSKVTTMNRMFYFSNVISLDLSNFDTSNVTDMGGMFMGAETKILDLSNFNIDNVTNMSEMFKNSKATIGYAKDDNMVSKFNDSSITNIPSSFKFVLK